jgi:predicted permease
MKLFGWFGGKKRRDQELDEEIRAHLAMAIRERIERGEDPAEAEANARREFGNATLVKEVTRDMWGWRWLETLLQDVRYGLRQFRRNPGFTAVAIITLALGIGANTAMFSIVNAVLLRPLPFHNPGRLVAIEGIPAVRIAHLNGFPNWIAGWEGWVSKTRTLAGVSFYDTGGVNLAGGEQPLHLPAAAVSTNFFRILGVRPVRGRTFLPQEEARGHYVSIIGYDLWQGRFAADPRIIGKHIELAGRPFTVIGVMPPGFEFPGDTQLWFPSEANVAVMLFGQQGVVNHVIARLKPGVTPEQVRSELAVFLHHMLQGQHAAPFNNKLSVLPLRMELVKDVRPALLVLLGAVGLVLLIACADVANLLMARNVGRKRELAVRAAIGAPRARLLRQLLTESVLLSLSGGVAGLVIGAGGVRLARVLIPPSQIPGRGIQLDGRVLAFALAAAIFTGVVSGLLPAFGGSKAVSSEALKEAPGESTSDSGFRGSHRLRAALGSLELALALILLIGASLLIQSLFTLSDVNPGFRTHHLLTARFFLTGPAYKPNNSNRRTVFYEQVLNRMRALPGVRDAAFVNSLPLGGGVTVMFSVGLEGSTTPYPASSGKWAIYCIASPDYFRAMGIPLLEGRTFNRLDRSDSAHVVIVSETMARRFWPGQDPVGRRITMFSPPQWMTVVGIVGDVHHWGLSEQPDPEMYVPLLQSPPQSAFLVLHTTGPVSVAGISRAVHAIDSGEPVAFVRTAQGLLAIATAGPRFRAEVLGIFAGLAALLALIGVYGIVSYSVAGRTHEIGIRMALGAQKSDVIRLVVQEGIALALAGLGAGTLGALALTRLLSSLLYGVRPTDSLTFAGVSFTLLSAALLACYIPARRATKVDPMVALRHE